MLHCMSTQSRKIPKAPITTDLRTLKTYVTIEMWCEAMDRAEKAGMSLSKYLAELIARDQLDESGRPVWATEPQIEDQLPLAG